MFKIRTMSSKDYSFAVELANTMNWNMASDDFAFNKRLEPNGCFVLLDESERVGIATCISYGHIGWFGNLIVKQDYRGQGAGTKLVKHAIEYLQSSGVTTVGLYAYPNLISFYGKIGFKRDADFVVLKSDSISPSSEINDFRKITNKELPKIIQLDSLCFGASRKKLLEKIIGPKNPCYLATEGDRTIGYIAANIYEETVEIGPLVCARDHTETAVSLLKNSLNRFERLEGYMYIPKTETKLLQAAMKAGFEKQFELARMFLGSPVAQNCVYMAESLERG